MGGGRSSEIAPTEERPRVGCIAFLPRPNHCPPKPLIAHTELRPVSSELMRDTFTVVDGKDVEMIWADKNILTMTRVLPFLLLLHHDNLK